MKIAFLFPGQGAQYPKMALDLMEASEEVKALFSLASEIFGRDMKDLLEHCDPEILKRTDVSQPCINLANLAASIYLEERGIKPFASAGFSLGEYAALAAAGVISREDCLLLVNERGKAMQAAIDNIRAESAVPETGAPGMMAVIGLAPEQAEALINGWKNQGLADLYAANINSPKQLVVSGSAAALAEAEKRFMQAGARRTLRLSVAGPFHSPYMKKAIPDFEPFLQKITFNDPVIPVFSNVTGKQIQSGAEAKVLALRQIEEAVRWIDIERALADLRPDLLLETGPGKVLQGLWKDSGSALPCLGAGTGSEIGLLEIKPEAI